MGGSSFLFCVLDKRRNVRELGDTVGVLDDLLQFVNATAANVRNMRRRNVVLNGEVGRKTMLIDNLCEDFIVNGTDRCILFQLSHDGVTNRNLITTFHLFDSVSHLNIAGGINLFFDNVIMLGGIFRAILVHNVHIDINDTAINLGRSAIGVHQNVLFNPIISEGDKLDVQSGVKTTDSLRETKHTILHKVIHGTARVSKVVVLIDEVEHQVHIVEEEEFVEAVSIVRVLSNQLALIIEREHRILLAQFAKMFKRSVVGQILHG